MSNEICKCHELHKDSIDRAKKSLPDDEMIEKVSDFFKAFSDKTRLKIMSALLREEMCVCDLAEFMNMSQSSISHQLRVLRQYNLVKFRREGKSVFYSLDDEHVRAILDQGIAHNMHKK